MSSIEFDPEVLGRVVAGVVQDRADQLQAVYDRVLQEGQGKSLEHVKVFLRNEFRAVFGTEITDPDLTACAEVLGSGRRIEVRSD